MKIVTIPHSSLRTTAQPVVTVDKKLDIFMNELKDTLAKKNHPRGVGLAAPQVNVKWRIFATQLPLSAKRETDDYEPIRIFINPEIVDHSSKHIYGPSRDDTTLEGCLSIPEIYGPVPRWQRITLRYDEITHGQLQPKVAEFADFAARVVQHEHDHLDGILFIDYSAEYGLPLYKEDPKTKKMVEIDEEMIATLLHTSQG